jgi:hypothetical protein
VELSILQVELPVTMIHRNISPTNDILTSLAYVSLTVRVATVAATEFSWARAPLSIKIPVRNLLACYLPE